MENLMATVTIETSTGRKRVNVCDHCRKNRVDLARGLCRHCIREFLSAVKLATAIAAAEGKQP